MRLLAALALTPLLAAGQIGGILEPAGRAQPDPPPAPQYQSEDLCSVEGQVVNTLTGEPLRRATMTLVRTDPRAGTPRQYFATSDGSGRFKVKNVTPGKYRLTFYHSGYVTAPYSAEGSSPTGTVLTLERAGKIDGIVFRATPQGVVTGRIVDENGDPVSYVNVQLSRFQYIRGKRQLVPSGGMASTNDLGEYRIFDVMPGKYYLSAVYRQGMRTPLMTTADGGESEDEYVPTFYPGVTDGSTATPIEIGPGSQASNINLRLARMHTVWIKGRVSPENASVMLIPVSARFNPATRGAVVDKQGNFQIDGVLPGSYLLAAVVSRPGEPAYSARQALEVGAANVEGLTLTAPPPVELSGTVRVGDGGELPANLRITLVQRDAQITYGPMPNGRAGADGAFTLQNVSPDVYSVSVGGLPPGYYVKAIRAGGADALAGGLDVTGGSPGQISITLSPNAGEITGVVENASQQPAPGATVTLVPQEAERRNQDTYYRSAASDDAGRFTLRNVIPGEYKVYAWERIESGAYMDPDFVKPFEGQGESVTVREGDKPNIRVKLIPAVDAPR